MTTETKTAIISNNLPVDNLTAYIQRVNATPMLTDQEEKDLATKHFETGDLAAAKRLVTSHLRYVVKVTKKYAGYGLSQADLIQEGNVGLMKAVKRFDPSRGVRLVSFAIHWIKAEIHEFILKNWRIVKVATTKAQRKLFFNLRSMKKQLAWFKKDETKHVADTLDVKEKTVTEMEMRMSAQDESFDMPVDDNDDKAFSPSQYLTDQSQNPELLLANSDSASDNKSKLMDAFATLDERSKDILSRRWLADENKATLQELAAEYSVSAERIRQLEKQAMNKIKTLIQ